MKFSALSVRARLTMGFGVVCALMLVIGGLGLFSMAKIDAGLMSVVEDRVPKMNAAHVILAETNVIAIALRNMMLSEEGADRKKQVEVIDTAQEQVEKQVEFLDRLTILPKGKELLDDVKAHRAKYIAGQKELIALVMENKPDEAKTYLNSQLRPVLGAYKAAIDALSALQVEVMTVTAQDAKQTYNQARNLLIGLGILALAMASGIGALITQSLLKELGGEPSKAAALARAVAESDFSQTIVVKAGDLTSLMASLSTMQSNLAKVVATVRQGSEGVATASAQIAQGNNDLSARTEQQASALEETAASMEQLSSIVKQNADSARQANQLAMSASSVAVQGGVVVNQVVETMKGINDASMKIADIISVIDGIAFQTNILALNAAVEAARAGEQGRGFAVVASEVRSLASRSAEAAKEIKTLIGASVDRVAQGTALVDNAGTTMNEVVISIKRVTDLMGEISAASNEQSLGVSQIGEAVTQMDQVTQQNAALVEEMAAAATSLKMQAQDLVEVVAVFNLGSHDGSPKRPSQSAPAASQRTVAQAPIAQRLASKTAPKPAVTRPALSKPATATLTPKTASQTIPAGSDDAWETF